MLKLNFLNKKKGKKSQLIAYDFIGGFVIFMIIIVLVSLYWFKNSSQIMNDLEADTKIRYAMEISNRLTMTTGFPERWELDINKSCLQNNCSIGLAEYPGVLSWDKVAAFVNLSEYNNTKTRSLFNLGRYRYQFTVRDTSNTVVATTGTAPGNNLSVSVRRLVLMNNSIYVLDYVIFK